MTPDDLSAAGHALYGERWQTSLARDLHVSDRTMRRWLAGEFAIPDEIVTELRKTLVERLKTLGGIFRFTINPLDHTVFHSGVNSTFRYDEDGNITLLHPGFAESDQLPLIEEGAKEALRRERERDPRIKGTRVDPKTGRTATAESLHGFLRGSVIIPAEIDLTAPFTDEDLAAEEGEVHR